MCVRAPARLCVSAGGGGGGQWAMGQFLFECFGFPMSFDEFCILMFHSSFTSIIKPESLIASLNKTLSMSAIQSISLTAS